MVVFPIAIPLFFLILLLKFVFILFLPPIVRYSALRISRKQTKTEKEAPTAHPTPIPPSDSPEGEDPEDDSYWARLKRWLDRNRFQIGFFLVLLCLFLAISLEWINPPSSPTLRPVLDYYPFLDRGQELTGELFYKKGRLFSETLLEIEAYYDKHRPSHHDVYIALNYCRNANRALVGLARLTPEQGEQYTLYVNNLLELEPDQFSDNFRIACNFISLNTATEEDLMLHRAWLRLVNVYLNDRGETPLY